MSFSVSLSFSLSLVPGMMLRSTRLGCITSRRMLSATAWDSRGNENRDGYSLIDCGNGRKLESFGGVLVERDCPLATWPRNKNVGAWKSLKTVRFNKPVAPPSSGTKFEKADYWAGLNNVPLDWHVQWNDMKLALSLSENGQQIGIFPEQSSNWGWIQKVLTAEKNFRSKGVSAHNDAHNHDGGDMAVAQDNKIKVLNCFAYTGGSSIAAAAVGGVQVTHVDASRRAIGMAKNNAKLSGIDDT